MIMEENFPEAVRAYEGGLRRSPYDRDIIFGVANALCASKQNEAALQVYQRVQGRDRESYEFLIGSSYAYMGMKRFEESLPFIMRAADLWPNLPLVLNNLAHVLNNLKRPDEALIFVDSGLGLANKTEGEILYLNKTREEILEKLQKR